MDANNAKKLIYGKTFDKMDEMDPIFSKKKSLHLAQGHRLLFEKEVPMEIR